jgi:hypothetical protein
MAKVGVSLPRSSKKQEKWTIYGRYGNFQNIIFYRTLKLGKFSDYRLSG